MRLLDWLTRHGRVPGRTPGLCEAEAALRRAEADLAKTRAQRPEVDRLVAELRRARQDRHIPSIAWPYVNGARTGTSPASPRPT